MVLCKNPFMKGVQACRCGQCRPCRILHKRQWVNRLLLEKDSAAFSTFATLTYVDAEVMDVSGDRWNGDRPVLGTLHHEHLQKFFKRLRKLSELSLRYYAVGEYGDKTGRPHYHLALFGFPHCVHGRTLLNVGRCCGPCSLVKRAWGHGSVELRELNQQRAEYLCGYVVKKWTKEDSWTKEKLKGRRPEFARMSLKPGIGAIAIQSLINGSAQSRQRKYIETSTDAPVVIRKSGRIRPLGKYLRKKWREFLGRSPKAPPAVISRDLSQAQEDFCLWRAEKISQGYHSHFLTKAYWQYDVNKNKILSLEKRAKIYDTRGH